MNTDKGKICVISLESKRNLNFSVTESACRKLAGCGYYADKVSRVAFDSSSEIVKALDDAKDGYENLIILCPQAMESTVKNYMRGLYSAEFDGLGVLNSGEASVFVFFTDGAARLNYGDVKKILDEKYSLSYDRAYIRACVPEDVLDKAVAAAREECKNTNIDVNINVGYGYGDCRIEALYSSKTPKLYFDRIYRNIVEELDDYIYAVEDISLSEQLIRLLKLRRMKISVAESFTGGGVGKSLVEVAGASEVYFEGLNTYSNQAKMQRLNVSEMTLKQHGAVSAETAYEMADGLLKTGNCDIAVSTTGIAGPKSDNTSKPVGLAYIGVGTADGISVYKFNFSGDREAVTRSGINQALFLAYKRLK